MKTIPLTQGMFAKVDDADHAVLSQWKWYALKQPNTYYACRDIRVDGRRVTVWMHRLINGTPAHLKTDHINGDGLDNQRHNLRSATHQQNMINSARHKTFSSRFRGVTWHKLNSRWCAQITIDKQHINLGSFATEEEAHKAYVEARELFRHGQVIRAEEKS